MRKSLLLALMLFGAVFSAMAQIKVSGTVKDDGGEALPGATVTVKGTTSGTVTDIDGKYNLEVQSGDAVLVFSFVGYETQEITVGSQTTIDVVLATANVLEEVVVTALGIQREKKALGYAVSSVTGKALEEKPEADVARMLNGKVTGVNITSAGGVSGTGTNIIIRGYSSITGSNQPLFVVDGVPFNTSTNSQSGFTGGGNNASSRFLDLDPNNIANIEVLKGLSATVLYGEQGRNGVILITTKGGNAASAEDFKFSVTQSVFANRFAALPDYQDTWGNGFQQSTENYAFSNWGDQIADLDFLRPEDGFPHPYDQYDFFPEYDGQPYEYRAYNSVENFFRTGIISNTSINLTGRKGATSYNITGGYNKEEGFVPNNNLEKFNFGIGLNSSMTDKLTISTTMNFTQTDVASPPLGASTGSNSVGDGVGLFSNVLYTPRTIDLMGLPFESPVDGSTVYYRQNNSIINPRWLAKNTKSTSSTQRLYGRTSISYDLAKDFTLTYRAGIDTYNEFQQFIINKGIGTNTSANPNLDNGVYRTTHITNTIWDHTILANYTKELSSDLTLSALIGVNARIDNFRRDGLESTGQLVFDVIDHGNYTTAAAQNSFSGGDINAIFEERWGAVYGQLNLDYKGYLYLNLQARNDWSSTLEAANNSILYPSISASFIPTEAFSGLRSDALNYLKFRVGYGTSAGFPSVYSTRNTLAANARAFVGQDGTVFTTNATSNFLGNPNLLPEVHSEIEFGVEAKFFNNRIGLDLSIYSKTTNDLITNVPLDPATGFTSTTDNVGKIKNDGVELGLNTTPIQSGDFRWDLNFNFFTYKSIVEELSGDAIVIAGFTGFAENALVEGEAYNAIRATVPERNDAGELLVGADGFYIESNDVEIVGDPNPDYTLSAINTLSYKGFTFNMQWDYRKGGDIFSITGGALVGRGLTTDTDFDRDQTVILPGVKASDGAVNDIQITATDAYFNNIGFGPGYFSVFDGTTIRLREVSLGYALPKSVLSNLPIEGLSITLTGQNLWYNAINFPPGVNFDTDVLGTGVGNGLGLDFLSNPASRRYGASLKITF